MMSSGDSEYDILTAMRAIQRYQTGLAIQAAMFQPSSPSVQEPIV